jgi:NADPH:quinone reductase-like Zn-dependent oxidoreductase
MAQAIRIHGTGGPKVMHWEEVELGSPKPGEVLVRQTAVGVTTSMFIIGLAPIHFRCRVVSASKAPELSRPSEKTFPT